MTNTMIAGLNGIDLVIIALVLILSIKGIVTGFVSELFNFIGIVGGIFVASRTSNLIATFADKNLFHMQNLSLMRLIGFFLMFSIIWLISSNIAKLLKKNSKQNGIGMVFAFLMAGLRYIFIFALIISALSRSSIVHDKMQNSLSTSKLYPVLDNFGSNLIDFSNIAPKANK